MNPFRDTNTAHAELSGLNATRPRDIFAAVGQVTIRRVLSLIRFINLWAALTLQALRPLTWRRTVRREFFHQCYLIGVRALPLTLITGGLVGLGLVFQFLYWLQFFGESEQVGDFLVLILIRELAPLLVGFIIIGRSGAAMLVELGQLTAFEQIRKLDAMGIDPFLFLLLPRVLAASLACFCLNITFLLAALSVGFIADNALGTSTMNIIEFADKFLEAMGPSEFAIMLCKPLFIGFGVALISCANGLTINGSDKEIIDRLPRAFVRVALYITLTSGFFSFIF